ncbi:MAG: hypothetical protein ACXWHH_11380 [Solirubrobacterales bacterium]
MWRESELLLKVKEPIEPEYPLLHPDLTLFTYLHLAPDRPLTEALIAPGQRDSPTKPSRRPMGGCRCFRP